MLYVLQLEPYYVFALFPLQDGPDLLPRSEMLRLLTRLIGIGGVQQQKTASKALVDLCRSASGDAGCAVAEEDEIEVILTAITSSVVEVRLAALQVSNCIFCLFSNKSWAPI